VALAHFTWQWKNRCE